jgi:hypothetical protein
VTSTQGFGKYNKLSYPTGTLGRVTVSGELPTGTLFAIANASLKSVLISSKVMVEGSVESAVQEKVIGPPEVGLLVIVKSLTAATNGRKNNALERKEIKRARMWKSKWMNTYGRDALG